MLVDIFKNWISSLLCIGIFITFIQLIMPKANLKKYIYSLIGIVTILTVVSPVINMFKNESVETSVEEVLNNISKGEKGSQVDEEKVKDITNENVKKEFIESIKKDITGKLNSKNITVKSINILINQNYDIEKVEVNIENIDKENSTLDSISKVVSYLNSEYDIDFSKITVIEEGM